MINKMIAFLLVALFTLNSIPVVQAQLAPQEVAKISSVKGKVWIKRGDEQFPAENDMKLRTEDVVLVEDKSEATIDLLIVRGRFTLKKKTQFKIDDYKTVMLIAGKFKAKTDAPTAAKTSHDDSIASIRTDFSVEVKENETIVDVSDGQVELKRKDEVIGANIIRDYKAVVPVNRSLTVVSSTPCWVQVGLSAILPGIGKMYAGRDINKSVATLSLGTIVAFAVFNAKREDASKDSIETYNDYKTEFKLDKIKELKNRYRKDVYEANKYLKLQYRLAGLYVVLAVYDTISTIRDSKKYLKTIKEIRGPKEEPKSSKIDLGIRDDAVLAKVCWNFE